MEIWSIDCNWRVVHCENGLIDERWDKYIVGEGGCTSIVPIDSLDHLFYMVMFDESGTSVGVHNVNKVYYRTNMDGVTIQ